MKTNHHLPAGIEHIGHEGHWVGTSRCVHHINNNRWKRRCLNHRTVKALARGLLICTPDFSYFPELERTTGGRAYRASGTLFHVRSQAIKRGLSNLALSRKSYNTHQGLGDDCPRGWPREDFNLPRCVNQDISESRKTIKEVLYLCNAENIPSHKTPNIWLSKIGITSSHCPSLTSSHCL